MLQHVGTLRLSSSSSKKLHRFSSNLLYLYGLFERKFIPIKEILWLSLTFCGFVVCTKLCLQNNTVGTYQLAKTLTTPVIIVLQTYFYGKSFSHKIKLTMVPITLGVLVNSYYDIAFNAVGAFWATVGVQRF